MMVRVWRNSSIFGGDIKLNMQLPSTSAITLLSIYPREMKTYVYIKTSLKMFTVALFILDLEEGKPQRERVWVPE